MKRIAISMTTAASALAFTLLTAGVAHADPDDCHAGVNGYAAAARCTNGTGEYRVLARCDVPLGFDYDIVGPWVRVDEVSTARCKEDDHRAFAAQTQVR